MDIAFLGLGNMGRHMARNLLKAGHVVRGRDVVPANLAQLAAAGGQPATSTAECVRGAEVVITMLPTGGHVRDVYLARDGVLASCRPDALLIDSSTIDPATARELAEAARARGVAALDAPVSGGTMGAEAGTLTFIVGGARADFERARPVLQAMGKALYHAGPSGAGQTVKICNNMLLAVQMAGTCEAIRLGIANGLDPALLSEIMQKSSGRNFVLEVNNPCPEVQPNAPASRGYEGGFSSDLMLKDVTLAVEAAANSAVATPMAVVAREIYLRNHEGGHGGLDFSSIFRNPIDTAAVLRRGLAAMTARPAE